MTQGLAGRFESSLTAPWLVIVSYRLCTSATAMAAASESWLDMATPSGTSAPASHSSARVLPVLPSPRSSSDFEVTSDSDDEPTRNTGEAPPASTSTLFQIDQLQEADNATEQHEVEEEALDTELPNLNECNDSPPVLDATFFSKLHSCAMRLSYTFDAAADDSRTNIPADMDLRGLPPHRCRM